MKFLLSFVDRRTCQDLTPFMGLYQMLSNSSPRFWAKYTITSRGDKDIIQQWFDLPFYDLCSYPNCFLKLLLLYFSLFLPIVMFCVPNAQDYKYWGDGDSDDDDDEVNDDDDVERKTRMKDREIKQRERERERERKRNERMGRRMRIMTDHNQED